MRIRFLEIAEIELDDTVRFYNNESPGLGDEFLTELLHVMDRVALSRRRGIHVRKEHGEAKLADYLTASFIGIRKTRYWLLPSPISTVSRSIGRID